MSNYFLETQWHEWLLTSQNGSYSLGTGNLINQRKYNGLLIKSDNDFNRYLLVSGIEELIEHNGGTFYLDSSHYTNCIYPEGFMHLVKSWLRPYPVFLYSSHPHTEDILIKKEILLADDGTNVLIKYTNLSNGVLRFYLRPKLAMRNHHHLNESGIFDSVHIHSEINKRDNQSEIDFFAQRSDNKISTFGWIQHGNVYQDKIIYKNVFYPWEATRGYPANEDLISPLCIEFDLKVNESNYLLFSDKEIIDAITIIDQVEKKYKKLPVIQEIPIKRKRTDISDGILEKLDYDDKQMFNYEDYMKLLEFSMRDFVANNDIIAGFPWFGCWGRDTMISLEGVLNLPKGDLLAYDILLKYANQIQNGLIPNMCSESFQQANYNSIDATLWFIIRLYQVCKSIETNHVQAKKDKLVRWKYAKKIVENIFECLLENNHPDFFIRYDGLLELREHFSSATWMDAKINNYAVTPRDGCPVEINALLFNAVCCYEKIIESHNALSTESDNFLTSQSFLEVSSRIKESFIKYWVGDFLADRLMGETPICEIRPNAIIAMSLPFSNRLLSQDKIQQLYETAFYELYTPYGLRTLSTRDYKFQKKYSGTLEERDYAYHNGTVWAWLLLPLVHTWFNAFPKKPFDETVQHITYVIDKLRNGYMYGHIASVAEVFDGDKPHFPKGCPAQAWSVSALFSIENILANFIKEKKL